MSDESESESSPFEPEKESDSDTEGPILKNLRAVTPEAPKVTPVCASLVHSLLNLQKKSAKRSAPNKGKDPKQNKKVKRPGPGTGGCKKTVAQKKRTRAAARAEQDTTKKSKPND